MFTKLQQFEKICLKTKGLFLKRMILTHRIKSNKKYYHVHVQKGIFCDIL